MGERQRIIDFWRVVELLSPQKVEAAAPSRDVHDVRPGEPLPWEPGHRHLRRPVPTGCSWSYTVYCGLFDLEAAYDQLGERYPPARDAYDERPPGTGALCAFSVDRQGRPILGSATLSSAAWAVGTLATRSGDAHRLLDGFDDAQAAFSIEFAEVLSPLPDDEHAHTLLAEGVAVGRSLDGDGLERVRMVAVRIARTEGLFASTGTRVACRAVRRRSPARGDHDFLNSFIADDLRHVSAALGISSGGAALLDYLDERVPVQLDVVTADAPLRASTSPQHVPGGRWPSPPEQRLSLSQQFAVNEIVSGLSGAAGCLSVNGPPGTGKTTMLRDVIAAIVVERADRLAELADPEQAFTGAEQWTSNGYPRTAHQLDSRLTGHEIVLACATNAAAENVSSEIPALGAIDQRLAEEADYFAAVATETLRAHDGLQTEAWGLIAARLGNSENRSTFTDAFWWGREPRDGEIDAPPTLQALLKGQSAGLDTFGSWREAVAVYRAAERGEREIARARHEAAARVDALAPAIEREGLVRRRHAEACRRHDEALRTRADAEQRASALRADLDAAQVERDKHAQVRPGMLEMLLSLGRASRRWRSRYEELDQRASSAERLHAVGASHVADCRTAADRAGRAVGELAAALRARGVEVQRLRVAVRADRERWQEAYPDAKWWSDRTGREYSAPWIDEVWNRARVARFLAALRLHGAFLRAARTQMTDNLRGAVELLRGTAPVDLSDAVALTHWQSLFLVVPVISTTFASLPRLFRHLGQESLGWLLIDEAGQATPQQAVGALWRSRRAVVVGDPMQLEPVVSVPFSVEAAISSSMDVARTWSVHRSSIQHLADRQTRFGTRAEIAGASLWVGMPLNLHRRCEEPMFSISNKIAYNERMVSATVRRDPIRPLRESCWFDVRGSAAAGHWVPDEGARFRDVLAEVLAAGLPPSEIFALSPFRSVASKLQALTRSQSGLRAGTVHVAQGQEAAVVILVLGGDPAKPRAKEWAAGTPNLLNVAVSRARRRLYVIGDRAAWSATSHCGVVAAELPVVSPSALTTRLS